MYLAPPSVALGATPITPIPFWAAAIIPATLVPWALSGFEGVESEVPVSKFHVIAGLILALRSI